MEDLEKALQEERDYLKGKLKKIRCAVNSVKLLPSKETQFKQMDNALRTINEILEE